MIRKITLFISTFLLLTLNLSPFTSQAQSIEEITKLLASDGASDDNFGNAVSISGDYAIVGAYGDDDNGSYSGSAYIYYYNGGIWQQQAKLTAPDGDGDNYFGTSVSICNNYAIVGEWGDDDNGSFSGSAYIYFNNEGNWQQQAKLTASDGAASDFFGFSVSVSSDYAIVGAYQDDDNGNNSGSVYIFYNNSGSWQQQAKLTASDGAADDSFGHSVSISGDYAITGAFGDDDNGSFSGSAYLFYNNGGNWQQQTKFVSSDGATGDRFGISVSISDNYAVVGAHRNDNNGSAYIFFNNVGIWQQQTKLIASDGADSDLFGYSVSISGEYTIVGAFRDDDSGDSSGSSYIYFNNSGDWQQQAKVTASDGASDDYFGRSVSISGDYAIIGAMNDNDNGTHSGSAYIFGPSQPDSDSLFISVFLEGPYNGTDMNTDLNPEPIPLSQPYNDPSKWNYQGSESVAAIPNADVVDWVLVELRETSGDASTALPDSMIAQQAAFILKDGSVVGLDGISPLYFDNEITNNLYVVVYHRNHLPIMSSGPLTATKGNYIWDFTTGMGQAYGTDAQVDLGGVFGMIGGDGNSNGQIEYYDKDSIWTIEAGIADYLFGDLSLDKQADNIDKNDIWKPNLDMINQVPGNQCEPQPDVADAGTDTDWWCDLGATLSANTPVNGTGVWTIVHGVNGSFEDIHDPGTVFYGEAGNTYKLKWTISTQCASTHDFVNIEFAPYPTQANAGPDQLNIPDIQTILEGNIPGEYEDGYWDIISGEGGSFEDEFDPTTMFYGVEENTYELRWMISNVCYPSEDYVTISFAEPAWACGEILLDDRDGQIYNTVQIGSQCWMAENLNYGALISASEDQSDNGVIEKYCPDNDEYYCNTYGGSYQWNELMQYVENEGSQGICPVGFYVPTDEEWKILEGFADSQYGYPDPEWDAWTFRGFDVGYNLRASVGWYGNGNGSDLYDFSALPGGRRDNVGYFGSDSGYGYYWTSTKHISNNDISCAREFYYDQNGVQRINESKNYGLRVRCLKGETSNHAPYSPSNPSPQTGSINVSIDTTFSWSCTDPDGDILTYNIYFGTDINPPLIQLNNTDTFYYPGILLDNTIYYWKIIAYDTLGGSTASEIWSFSTGDEIYWQCGDTIIDTRNGFSYNTVQVGNQCWMAENLNIGNMIIGTEEMLDNDTIEKYCYGNDTANCETYGGLYQWEEMMEYQTIEEINGICPSNWHLPSDAEWLVLSIQLGGESIAGGKMKEVGTTHWASPNTGATNSSGFTALPGGQRYTNGYFGNLTTKAGFWSSSENGTSAWYQVLSSGYTNSHLLDYSKAYGFSVRCIKDE